MDYIRKNLLFFSAGFGSIMLYFLTRLTNLTFLPIFTDEAIYIRWSQIAKQDASWRFISLTDGKQPMYVWVDMIFLKFIHDPLLASRLVSVGAGLLSLAGVVAVTHLLFKNKWTSMVAGLLYVIFPYSLVYDRMAMYDSMVAMFVVWSLFFEILLVKKQRFDLALVLGMVIGGGMLTKSNADFAIILMPTLVLLFDFSRKDLFKRLLKWSGFLILAAALAYGYYSILRLSPFFHIIDEKNALFVYPISQWIHHPFTYFVSNISGLTSWLISYVTLPGIILILGALFLGIKKYWREKLLLIAWFILPFIALALFGKTIYPRFMLFMTIPLLPLGAYSIVYIWKNIKPVYISAVVVFLLIFMMIRSDFYVITDFYKAPIAQADVNQYANSWAAGNGVKQSVAFFKEKSKSTKIFIGTQGTFGLMPFAYEIYLVNNPNIILKSYWPIHESMPKEISTAAKKMPAYVVFYEPCPACTDTEKPPSSWPVKLLSSYQQGTSGSFLRVYQVLSR